jgi:hypothetical protein
MLPVAQPASVTLIAYDANDVLMVFICHARPQ